MLILQSAGLQHNKQLLLSARNDLSLTCFEINSFFTGSFFISPVLRYFLLSSGKTVTTTAFLSKLFWTFTAPKKLAPEEIPTPRPSAAASFANRGPLALQNAYATSGITPGKVCGRTPPTNAKTLPMMAAYDQQHPSCIARHNSNTNAHTKNASTAYVSATQL